MNQFAGSTFGIGSPTAYPGSLPWGFSPQGGQPFGAQPFAPQPYPYQNPYASQGIGGFGIGAGHPVQQLLQIIPQQLQQVQALQQLQVQYLQQLLQIVPAQLQQIQQLVQIIPQQLQQQTQPFGQAIQNPFGLGFLPQTFSSQGAGHVM